MASATKCANCEVDATMRCVGCIDAPEYRRGDSTSVVYCGRNCQKEHWKSHKAHCNAMRKRKKLLRAAKILKAALLTYREAVYDIDLTKVVLEDGILCLYQNRRSLTAQAKRGPFPSHITSSIEYKEAALAHNSCTTAMALLGRLTRKLLAGVPSTIERLDLYIGKPLVPVKLIPGPDSTGCPHTVLKVRPFFTNEDWIFDTTGCQYGFQDVLVPFDKYITDKVCQILSGPTTYDATETKDLDYFSTLPFMNMAKAQRKDRESERKARLHFADFVDRRVEKDFLGGSEADFKLAFDGFVRDLNSHMLVLK